jgi:hypothetical protein
MRLSFIRDTSDRVELEGRETDSDLLKALESIGQVALGGKWDEKMEAKQVEPLWRTSQTNSGIFLGPGEVKDFMDA